MYFSSRIVPLTLAALTCGLWAPALPAAQAQPATAALALPENVLRLSASGHVEVAQDWLTLSLTTAREGADAAAVQSELRKAVDAALAELKKTAAPGQMDVRTGEFSIYPRYDRNGKISGSQGRAELVL
jgi:predicted secreted protein